MKGDSESDSCAAQETRKNVEQKELGPSALKQSEESTAASDHMNTIRTVPHTWTTTTTTTVNQGVSVS